MSKIFLSSSFADVAQLFNEFVGGNLVGQSVSFIPTASLVEEETSYVNEGRTALSNLGLIVNELDISTAAQEHIKYVLQNCDYIFIAGGNTFFLLQELKRTGTDVLITEQVKAGKVYIGESAGAIVTAPTIEYSKWMDSPEKATDLSSYEALRLVDFYTVPHYGFEPFTESVDKIMALYDKDLPLKPISNSQAILVNGDNISVQTA